MNPKPTPLSLVVRVEKDLMTQNAENQRLLQSDPEGGSSHQPKFEHSVHTRRLGNHSLYAETRKSSGGGGDNRVVIRRVHRRVSIAGRMAEKLAGLIRSSHWSHSRNSRASEPRFVKNLRDNDSYRGPKASRLFSGEHVYLLEQVFEEATERNRNAFCGCIPEVQKKLQRVKMLDDLNLNLARFRA